MLLRIVLIAAVLYCGFTAYCGWRVGTAIAQAEHHNLLVRLGAHIIGRDTVERLALRQANLPAFITRSPSFWTALRLSE